jgi:hypothetical protein
MGATWLDGLYLLQKAVFQVGTREVMGWTIVPYAWVIVTS